MFGIIKKNCHACNRRQRACIWSTNNTTVCARCTKHNLKCIPLEEDYDSDIDDDVSSNKFAAKTIEYWQQQITQLESSMQELEVNACHLVNRNHDNDDYNLADSSQSRATCKSVIHSKKRQQKDYEWKLSIKDGLLKLHSRVDTIEDLLQYGLAFTKYLAPYEGVIRKSLINIKNMSHSLILQVFCFVYTMSGRLEERSKSYNLLGDIHLYRQHQNHQPSSCQSKRALRQSYLQIHYRSIIDHLIVIYTNYGNSRRLFLHIPAFLKHYHNLKDPLKCPITLAVCIHTLCTSRRVISKSAAERREIADFFYSRCKDILYDMFDDSTRILETVIAINLLQYYDIFVLLRFDEARRWSTIAYNLCKDLEAIFGKDTLEPKQRQQTHVPPEMQRSLFKRHLLYAENTLQFLDCMVDGSIYINNSPKQEMKVTYMEPMPGEDCATYELLETHNQLLKLCTNPYMTAVTTHMKKMDMSTACDPELSLDILVQLHNTIQDWWTALPTHLRLCDDLYGNDAVNAVEKNESIPKAVIFSFVHSILLKIYTFVLEMEYIPSRRAALEQDDGDDMTPLNEKTHLYNRARSSARIQSCELLIGAVKRIFTLHDDIFPFMLEFISRMLYALLTVSNCSKSAFSTDLRENFRECYGNMLKVFPSDNIVPASISPLAAYYQTFQLSNTDIYQNYPLPGYALLADLLTAGQNYPFQQPMYGDLASFTDSAFFMFR
ncbi:hypothetical protein BDB00DRAFT_851138 [Zychaea mexicana]|uniref:uncharacterized protein n=1 Tax=Zychaea mexicana TaxID=64656 RepID=UPI0022FF17FB|nr:uncharacterized protein BDB00DRAFT_851138 [Zychaea mexicana]KAI9485124.1 hypothetical protein BDB00DRAFT_851138 [Zychaea mexicana]